MSSIADKTEPRRTIRSYVRRTGRLTSAQKRAMETLWPRHGIAYSPEELDFDEIFGRQAPRIMEIGFGNGELLLEMAANRPETDFIGVEVHEPGIGHCLMALDRANLTNVRFISHDAVDVLRNQIPDRALSGLHLFFPDPWPKKKHRKRRIVQPDFVDLLARKIAVGGVFHAATDWANYAEQIEATVSANPSFEPFRAAQNERLQTKFEQRGKNLGYRIWEQVYRRVRCTQDPGNAL